MSNYYTDETITDTFEEVRFETGLVQSDFTTSLVHNGVLSILPVTITEIGLGLYSISFTPDQSGTWSLSTRVTSHPQARYQKSYSIKENVAQEVWTTDLQSIISPGNVADYLNRVKKYTTNSVIISGGNYVVKEDDGVTDFEEGIANSGQRTPL